MGTLFPSPAAQDTKTAPALRLDGVLTPKRRVPSSRPLRFRSKTGMSTIQPVMFTILRGGFTILL